MGFIMKFKNIIIVCFILSIFFLSVPCLAFDNPSQGQLKIYNLDLSNGMQNNIFKFQRTDGGINNSIVEYNSSTKSADITYTTANNGGQMYVGGYYPATTQNLTFEIGIDRDDWNGNANIITPTAYITIFKTNTIPATGYRRYILHLYALNGSNIQIIDNNGTEKSDNFSLINYDENRTVELKTQSGSIYYPYYSDTNGVNLPYPAAITPLLYIYPYQSISNYTTVKLYKMEQYIPRKSITAYSVNNIQSFGLDGPHDISTIQNGIDLMTSHGQRGTIWADVGFLTNGREAYIKSLMSQGWELGIHFNKSLSTQSYTDATNEIDTEMEFMKSMFGEYPKTWCSLQNGDNVSHANYIYEKYGAYWRNGYSGDYFLANLATLNTISSGFWYNAITGGVIYPVMSHELDISPAPTFATEPELFSAFSNGYNNSNIKIESFYTYYKNAIAQNETAINITTSDENATVFNVTTYGKWCSLNMIDNYGSTAKVYLHNSSVDADVTDNNISFIASNGTYYIFNNDPSPNVSLSSMSILSGSTIHCTANSKYPLHNASWDFENDGIVDNSTDTNSKNITLKHTYYTPGNYIIKFSYKNDYGTYSKLTTITVSNPGFWSDATAKANWISTWLRNIFVVGVIAK